MQNSHNKPDSDVITTQLKTLSLHSRLVLCTCLRLLSRNSDAKVTVMDVFTEYRKLAARFNINWLSISKVTEHIKELEMLGFLKCTYPRMGQRHEIKYIYIPDPDDIPGAGPQSGAKIR